MQQSQTQQQQQQQQQIVPDTFLPLKNQRLINEENSPVDLSKLNIEQQQQQQQRQQNSIIFPSSSSSSTTNAKLNSIVGMDLTVAHNNNNGQSQSSTSTTISTTSTTLESHSKHIKKVLKHYQAAATLSLNGPDWFLPIVSATTTTTNASTINGNNNSMIVSSAAAAAAASQSLTDNDVLELTKTKSNTVVDNNKIAGIFNTTTLDLRTTTAAASTLNSSSTATITNNNKQTLSPYLSAAAAAVGGGGGGGHSSLSTNQGLTSLKDIFDPLFAPPPFPIQQPPLLTPPDQGPNRIERTETKLEGELIACFMVGGELRLCVPQIFNIVLRDFTLQQINQVIEELQINCSTCTRDQMEVLKLNGDIPPMAPSCGLITKTDAHRLCSTLLGSSTGGSCVGVGVGNITETTFINEPYILVYHECFGRCIGRYLPTLYTNDLAQCIQCNECMSLFTTFSFVCHSHKQQQQQQQYGNENRTVHWGFDPLNWRSYLLPIEDLASLDDDLSSSSSSLLMIISSNNLQSLLIDQKNLSHLLLLIQNSKLSASSASSSSASSTLLIPPCCTGGRKAFKSSSITDTALYQSIDNIRLIMKDMKCRFAKQTTTSTTTLASSSSSSKLNSSSRLLTGNFKRKDMTFDTSILSTKPSSLLMSLESQLNQTLSSNKRIKTEPLDLHHQQHYSNIGGSNGGDNLSTTMSPFVYPFLQSYLTSGMMMTPSSLSNDDLKQQQTKSQKDFFTTQQQKPSTTNTNYLSTLLNGAALAAATATSSVNSLTSSSLINNNNTNSSNAFITNILQNNNNKSLDSSTSTTNKLQSKSLFQANNYGQLASTVNNTDRLYNLSNVDLINQSCMQFSHQPSTAGGNSNGQQQQNHCHPIDRLISDSLLNNQSKKELKSETQTKHSSNEISLAKTLIGGNGRTLLFPSKNHSNSSSSLYESSASPSIKLTNQKNDDNNTIQQSQSDLLWPFASTASAAAHQSILSSAKHLKENQNSTNKNLASLISPTTLMEGNLYNTIHMLQKMRHLCFELGMTPNSFERSSSTSTTTNRNFSSKENAQHEVETRIQMLGQLIKDSSFEALKRNLSMIEYLIDDILVHFINNNHQLPSSGSMIMERFKKRMFTNILDMLEDIFAEQLSSTNPIAEQQLSNLKVEDDDDDDDVMVGDQKKSMSSSKDNEHLIAQDKIKKEQQQQSFDLDSDSKTTNSNNTIQEPSESVHSSYSSSIQIIEEDETQSPKGQKNDTDENIVDHSDVVDNHLAKDNNSSIPITESNLIDSLVAHHLLTNGFHHNNHHPNRSTIEAINEQLSHAISTLAAAAASVSSSSSSSSPPLRSSPLSSNTIVPSLSSTNKSFHHHHYNRMANQFHRNLSTNNVIVDDDDDDDDTGTSSKATTSTTSTTTTNLTQQPSLLLATGSPN